MSSLHTGSRRTRLALAALATSAALLGGCFSGRTYKDTRVVEAAHIPGSALLVETGNGAVKIVRAEVDQVVITAALRARTEERLALAEVVAERSPDGVLLVFVEWPDGKKQSNEGCRFDIQVPDAIGVDVATGNGAVEIRGLAGPSVVRTSNGAVVVADQMGPVDVHTSNGRITVERARGAVTARTSNGRVVLTDVDGPVDAQTSNGRVEVALSSRAEGPVNIRTSNGAVELILGPAFQGRLSLDTSNGGISVSGVEGAVIRSLKKRSAQIEVGDDQTESRIRTSNGGISVSSKG